MLTRPEHSPLRHAQGYALGEVLLAFGVLMLVFSGLIYGYVQANRMAQWSAMSLAAQASAAQGAEQARAADWRPRDWPQTNGPGTMDELPPTNYTIADFMDIPMKGSPSSSNNAFLVTNYISIINTSTNPPIRQIRSDCHWVFPLTGALETNTVILLRAADQ